jgi:hypothetical protein
MMGAPGPERVEGRYELFGGYKEDGTGSAAAECALGRVVELVEDRFGYGEPTP